MLQFYNSARNKNGFTLIELIIVIAILAILAVIAMPAYSAYKTQAAIGADTATCKIIFDAGLADHATDGTADTTDIAALIDGGVMPTPQQTGIAAFTITITGGSVTKVAAGTAQYPPE